MNNEDAKTRSEAEMIWKTGKQENSCSIPAFLLSKFMTDSVFAPSRLVVKSLSFLERR
jgi:hypothetical protein